MNYKESKLILEKIKNSKRILLMCHISPDPDSIASCLVMKRVIEKLGTNVDIYSNGKLPLEYETLDKDHKIIVADPNKVRYDDYDTMFTLDVTDISRLRIDIKLPKNLLIINIDHHDTTYPSEIQIKDRQCAATTEILFYLFEDFEVDLDPNEINLVMIGVISDSDSFQYNVNPQVFRLMARLIELGGSYDKACALLWRNRSTYQIRFTAEMLSNIAVDKKYKFAYTSMNYKDYKKFKNLLHPTRSIADNFIRTIRDTNFGLVMLEQNKGELKVSVRSKTEDYSVLDIVEQLGGGGYLSGGGAIIRGLPFDKAVRKVLETARKYAK